MRTDVKTLIAALTTERNSIDRAIAGLKQMSDAREPETVATAAPVKRRGARLRMTNRAKRQAWSLDPVVKMRAAAAMRVACDARQNLSAAADEVSRTFGLRVATVLSGWRRWEAADRQQVHGNGSADLTPELAGALQ